jgi:hypothetical protein
MFIDIKMLTPTYVTIGYQLCIWYPYWGLPDSRRLCAEWIISEFFTLVNFFTLGNLPLYNKNVKTKIDSNLDRCWLWFCCSCKREQSWLGRYGRNRSNETSLSILCNIRRQSYNFSIYNYNASVFQNRRKQARFQKTLGYSLRCNFLQRWRCNSWT